MRKLIFLFFAASSSYSLPAQDIHDIINPSEVERIEKILSADDMQGRATFTPGIEKAADFISAEFKSAGLLTVNNSGSYRQPFTMVSPKLLAVSGTFDGRPLDPYQIVPFSTRSELTLASGDGYEKVFIKAGDNLSAAVFRYIQGDKNYLVLMDTSFSRFFPRLSRLTQAQFKSDKSVIFVLSNSNPVQYTISFRQDLKESSLANLVGILPGNTKKDEYVIFSAHYDHLGIGKPNEQKDSIYNGANDDASGTTAVIMLAKYFSKIRNNERTLVFAAFTAEEIGEYGSQYFSRQFDPAKVAAMFNIEMIGTESKWGANAAYITGYERTDMGKILEKNLQGSQFTFYPDPYPQQQLFYRSDNATLARQGVPAHTISTSKMDAEKYYHTPADEIGTLDMKNMAQIISAIAVSSTTIVAGKDTPSRVDTRQLR